ncbi:hypothetical protein GIB67_004750 [Kingdonia uniflora]|uniref:Uncharacterized protein n=1 Tax=Kingdonia uniflora TaxID=39325 RepID=A0A7J7NQM2_9MAGN|nr:hypothetical protein GIB67_004750 [Kingdonia uniflora]
MPDFDEVNGDLVDDFLADFDKVKLAIGEEGCEKIGIGNQGTSIIKVLVAKTPGLRTLENPVAGCETMRETTASGEREAMFKERTPHGSHVGGHFVFIDNPSGFHSAVFHACRKFLSPDSDSQSLPDGLSSA